MARSNATTSACFHAATGVKDAEAAKLGELAEQYNTGDITADYVSAVHDVMEESQRLRDAIARKLGASTATDVTESQRQLLNAALGDVSPQDVATLEQHYGAESGSKTFMSRLRDDIVTYSKNGAQAVSSAVRAIIKTMMEGVLAMGVIFNPGYLQQNFSFNPLQTYHKTVTTTQDIKAEVPANAREKMSPLAQQVYESMAPTAKASGKGFIIADKPNGMVHFFAADGTLLAQDAALYGKDKGDALGTTSSLVGGRKITPAGSFVLQATPNAEYKGGMVLKMAGSEDANGDYVAVHSVWLGDPKERRAERLRSPSAEDNRVSFGCVNTTEETFLGAVMPNIDKLNGGMAFVLPDDQSTTETLFPKGATSTTTTTESTPGGADQTLAQTGAADRKEDPRMQFSSGVEPGPKYTVQSLVADLKKFMRAGQLGNRVHVVATATDLKNVLSPQDWGAFVASEMQGGKAVAFAMDGTAYMIADRTPTGAARAIFMHEVGVHLGLQNTLNMVEFKALADQIAAWAKADDGSIESELAQRALARTEAAETDAAQAQKEHVAYFVEEAMKRGITPSTPSGGAVVRFLQRVMKLFRSALEVLRLAPEMLTAQDVVDLAYGAAHIALRDHAAGTPASQTFKSEGEGVHSKSAAAELGAQPNATEQQILDYYSKGKREPGAKLSGPFDGPGTERFDWGPHSAYGPHRNVTTFAYWEDWAGESDQAGGGRDFVVALTSPETVGLYNQTGNSADLGLLYISAWKSEDGVTWNIGVDGPSEDSALFKRLAARGDAEVALAAGRGPGGEIVDEGYTRLLNIPREARDRLFAEARRRLTRVQGGEVPALQWVRDTGRNPGKEGKMSPGAVARWFSKEGLAVATPASQTFKSEGEGVQASKAATVRYREGDSDWIASNGDVLAGMKRLDENSDVLMENPSLAGAAYISGMDRQADGRSGRASDLLKAITNWADARGETLALTPAASGPLKQADLVAWYERNGFVHARDGVMVRKPAARLQFSKAAVADADNSARAQQTITEKLQATLSPQARDGWARIADFFHKHFPWLLTSDQLVEQYGAKLTALKVYVAKQKAMTTARNTMADVFHKIAIDWDKMPKAVVNQLNTVMLRATLQRMHPDEPATDPKNRHLTPEERAAHAKLRDQYEALPPEAKAIYQKARKALDDAWDERREAYRKLVDYAYSVQLERALEAKDKNAEDKVRQAVKDAIDAYDSQLKEIRLGPYFPLLRFGNYLAIGESAQLKALQEKYNAATGKERRDLEKQLDAMRKDAKHYEVSAHENKGAANAAERALKARGLETRQGLADQHLDGMRSVSQDTLSHINDMIDAQFGPRDADALKVKQGLSDIFLNSLPEMHALRREAARKGIEGASPDMLRAFSAAGQQSAFYTSRLLFARDLADTMFKMKAEAKASQDTALQHVAQEMEKRMALDMRRNETPVQDAANSLSWVYHLGMSPSFLVINASQPWLVTGPVLAGRFGFAKASKALGAASLDAVKLLKNLRMKDMGNGQWKWDPWSPINEELLPKQEDRKVLRQLLARGIIDESALIDLNMFANDSARWVDKTQRVMTFATQQVELTNRVATALASYRLARESMTEEQAIEYAYNTTLKTQFDYSQEGTARVMREGGGVPLAKMIFQFRRYQQAMLYLLGDNIKKAAFSPEDRKHALATLGYFAVSSGAAAGALGLPFAATAMLVRDLFIPDDDPEGDAETRLRNMIFHMTGDKKAADVLTKGLPALWGWDLSARVGLGDIASPFPMNRFGNTRTGRETAGELALNALGPTGGLAAQFFDAYSRFGAGDWQKGTEKLMPKFMADPLKAARYASEGLTDGKNTPTGTKLDAWDVFSKSLGVTPTREADYYEGTRAIKQVHDAVKSRQGKIGEAYREGLRSGDMADAREMVNAWNERHPENRIDAKMEQQWRKEFRDEGKHRTESGVHLGTKKNAAYNHLADFAQ